jgi:hypothetical protein
MPQITFPVPEGFEPPEGSAPGDTFEVLATVTLSEDGGELSLESVDGLTVGAPETPTEEVLPETETPGFIEAMSRGVRE